MAMAKRSLEDFLARFVKRHEGDVREQLAQALHKNSHWDNTMSWEPKDGTYMDKFRMDEEVKETWRWMADRFTNEISPKFGIKVIKE
jgi:hypothetical protein